MKRLIPALLAALLTACPAAGPVTTGKVATPRPTSRPASAKPTAGPSAAAVAAGKLAPPPGGFRAITGTVQLDAAYAVGPGGASIIANNGGGVLQLGDAALISDQGGNLIANNGGGIISDNGGGLVSDAGGGIVGSNTAGLVGKAKFGLLQAAAPAPAFGQMLPAAGLAVGVIDLATGTLLPLGRDAAGRVADVVVTDEAGGFTVWLPEAKAGTVRVVGVPRTGADPRLRAALLSSDLAPRIQLDEDTQRVAADVRRIMATNFYRSITTKPEQVDDLTTTFKALFDAQAGTEIGAGSKRLIEAFTAAGVPALPLARQLAIADRLADVVIARVDLGGLRALAKSQLTGVGFKPADPGDVGEPALALFGSVMAKVRANVAKVMAAEQAAGRDPAAYFAAKDYIQAAAADGGDFAIRKPADFGDFLIRGVLANPALDNIEATVRFGAILTNDDVGLTGADAEQLIRAQAGISIGLTLPTYAGKDPILPEVLAALEVAAR